MNQIEIADWIAKAVGVEVDPNSLRPVSGGCINEAWLLDEVNGSGSIFVKTNRPDSVEMFEAERKGLQLLDDADAIRVPVPHAVGIVAGKAVLAMEGIAIGSSGGPEGQEKMGRQLAQLHETISPNRKFGADFDNHIGATPQKNGWENSWAEFFVQQRLQFQVQLASKNGSRFRNSEEVLQKIHRILSEREVNPSLLHGDLWGGNAGFDENGQPVIFDPAVYFGDREADIAFTKMFGGFGPAFYRAYRDRNSAPENEYLLHEIYNLYHVLNHYNLFGGGYGTQAEIIMNRILHA